MIIALTGGIAAGKSTIARSLAQLGYLTYDTDSEAKRLIRTRADLRAQIIKVCGPESFDGDQYCTRHVAQQIFADESKREALNRIVHPAVCEDVKRWAKEHEGEVVFVETALLWESGLDKVCDHILYIEVSEEERLRRLMLRDDLTREQAEARIASQR